MNKLQTTIIRQQVGDEQQAVDARQLHAFLENGDKFTTWISDRIQQYGFVEGIDYIKAVGGFSENTEKPSGGRPSIEYALTIDMAKELAMVERNAKGKEARMYFLEMERQARGLAGKIPQSLPEALRMAAELHERTEQQAAIIKQLAPKADFYDEVADAVNSMSVEEVAKMLGTGRNRMFEWLRKSKVLMANNLPYQKYVDREFFVVRERTRTDTKGEVHQYCRTLVTGKGIQLIQKHWGSPLLVMDDALALA